MVPFSMQERESPLESESVEERILLRKSCSIEWKVPCERIVISEELDQKKRHFHLLHLLYTHLTLLDYPVASIACLAY